MATVKIETEFRYLLEIGTGSETRASIIGRQAARWSACALPLAPKSS
jgi:hypothetical protein